MSATTRLARAWRGIAWAGMLAGAVVTAQAAGTLLEGRDVEPAGRDGACEQSWSLGADQQLRLCGRALQLLDKTQHAAKPWPVLKLKDDHVTGVRTWSLADHPIALAQGALRAVVAIDLGSEGCFGTQLVGLVDGAAPLSWGIVDEVQQRGDDAVCVSKAMSVTASDEGLAFALPPDALRPTHDGDFVPVKSTAPRWLVRGGKFCRKGAGCGPR